MEITKGEIVNEAMGNHDKHYWALVHTIKGRRKGWAELADLIGEGSTVAKAIWDKYLDFDFNKPLAGSPAPTPPLDVEAAAREILSQCAMKFVTPDYFSKSPQKVIDQQIKNAADILRRHIASPAQPEKPPKCWKCAAKLPHEWQFCEAAPPQSGKEGQ